MADIDDQPLTSTCGAPQHSETFFISTDLTKSSDKDLLNLIKNGCNCAIKQALGEAYDRYGDNLLKYLRKEFFGIDTDDMDDIFADVWKMAIIKLPKVNKSENHCKTDTPIRSWLFATAKYKSLEFMRYQRKAEDTAKEYCQAFDIIDASVQLDNQVNSLSISSTMRKFTDELIIEALEQLSPEERMIIELIYFNGKTSAEIGKRLGLLPNTVRQKHKRALGKLHKILEELLEED